MAPWTVREKTILLINRWYLIFLTFLISAGLAWGVMHLWPPQHKASMTVYVGINMSRVFDVSSMATYAKTEPFNVDDYKNWHLSQLESIARSEEVADAALTHLREVDPYWKDITTQQFQDMQYVAWRDMGTWRLTIDNPHPERAEQGVREWSSVFVAQVSNFASKAVSAFKLDGKLRAVNAQQVQLETGISEMRSVEEELSAFRSDIEEMDPDQTLEPILRWQLWGLAAGFADHSPLWTEILEEFPGAEEENSAYIAWIDDLLRVFSVEKEIKRDSLEKLGEEEDLLTERFVEEVQNSKGLSPALTIEKASPKVTKSSNYPDAIVALLGGTIGVMAYLIAFLFITEFRGV
ncbi:MAG: hypothetical protein R6U57_09115 [Anaerolineales bacterium]